MQGAGKVMVWAGIRGDKIIGPIFINGNLNANKYLNILQEEIFPSLLSENGNFPAYFQQDGAPLRYGIQVRQYLNQILSDAWIGRRGPVEGSPRSPGLTPLDFYFLGHLKAMVYKENVRDINHLKDCIINSFAQISPDVLLRVHSEWVKRIMMCIQNNGGHIEPVI